MGRIKSKCTALVEQVMKKAKKPLSMRQILAGVNAIQIRNNDPHPLGRRDVYNAVHNNTKEDGLFQVEGEAMRGQHGKANEMVYSLRA